MTTSTDHRLHHDGLHRHPVTEHTDVQSRDGRLMRDIADAPIPVRAGVRVVVCREILDDIARRPSELVRFEADGSVLRIGLATYQHTGTHHDPGAMHHGHPEFTRR